LDIVVDLVALRTLANPAVYRAPRIDRSKAVRLLHSRRRARRLTLLFARRRCLDETGAREHRRIGATANSGKFDGVVVALKLHGGVAMVRKVWAATPY